MKKNLFRDTLPPLVLPLIKMIFELILLSSERVIKAQARRKHEEKSFWRPPSPLFTSDQNDIPIDVPEFKTRNLSINS